MTKISKIFTAEVPELTEKQEDILHQIRNARTTPRDQRFPSQNQAGHCWNRYNEWLLCMKQSGDEEKCAAFRQYSRSVCPNKWMEEWDEARSEGKFQGLKD